MTRNKDLKRIAALALALGVAACQAAPSGETRAGTTAAVPQTEAQEWSGPPERTATGLAFAQAACGECHAVEAGDLSPNPQAPTFKAIVNRQGLTEDTLATWLRDAHNYPEVMDFDLDAAQAEDLAAYMVTLHDEAYQPPIF